MAEYTFTKRQLESEIWKPVPNYEGLYEVSNIGRVRGVKTNIILKPQLRKYYWTVALSNKAKLKRFNIHILVALAFIGERPPKKTTNHKDLNKFNNSADNLEYITQKQNIRHAKKLGRMPKGSQFSHAKIKETDVELIYIFSGFGIFQHKIAEYFHLSKTSVGDIIRGKNWRHVKPPPQPEVFQIQEDIFEFEFAGMKYALRQCKYSRHRRFRRMEFIK